MTTIRTRKTSIAFALAALVCAGQAPARAADPDASSAPGGIQSLLVAPLESAGEVVPGGWMIENARVRTTEGEKAAASPKVGRAAVMLEGVSSIEAGKGDFAVHCANLPAPCRKISFWFDSGRSINIARIGVQVGDSEDEALMATVAVPPQDPATRGQSNWIRLTFDPTTRAFSPAYKQDGKDGRVTGDIRDIHIVWFTTSPGPARAVVNGFEIQVPAAAAPTPMIRATLTPPAALHPGDALKPQLLLTNFGASPASVHLVAELQSDPAMSVGEAPDPVYGSNRAAGMHSWTVYNDKTIEENSLTDADTTTAAALPWGGPYVEAFQYVDLGRSRHIKRLSFRSSDANWLWFADVYASIDGKDYQPVASLQNVNLHQKWGTYAADPSSPFDARYLRFRYHKNGEATSVIRMPAELYVYDGVEQDPKGLPSVGPVVGRIESDQSVPAHGYALVDLPASPALTPGCYFLGTTVKSGDASTTPSASSNQSLYRTVFVMPEPMASVSPASRFGLNSALSEFAAIHRYLGVGWVRFENLKWPFVSQKPGEYNFTGKIEPWKVDVDAYIKAYRDQGISVLPTMFQTPRYAAAIPPRIKKHTDEYPPTDPVLYGQFVFQTVARFGSRVHPEYELKSDDKKSGLGQMNTYEMWNEPDLNNPDWGAFVGPFETYLNMFREGAEAVKRADPAALVTTGGLAGVKLDTLDQFRTYSYADGKHPIDFVDVINVHHYTGRSAPELATINSNTDRTASGKEDIRFEDQLRTVARWRDRQKPGAPIWLTETGYDTGGPQSVPERTQAAWLVRDLIISLASGIDKVFVYREQGSGDSLFAASGVIADDHSLRPSWFTYATLIRQMDGATDIVRLPLADQNVRLYGWRTSQGPVVAAWSILPSAKLGLDFGKATVTDAFGAQSARAAGPDTKLVDFPIYLSRLEHPDAVNAMIDAAQKQQKENDQADIARRKALAASRTMMFHFGNPDPVGTIDLDEVRRFTVVPMEAVYDAKVGYGFAPDAALQNDSRHWLSDPLLRNGCRLDRRIYFRIDAPPGRYKLRLVGGSVSGKPITVKIEGLATKPVTAILDSEDKMIDVDIKVGAHSIIVSGDDYWTLRWLTLMDQK